MVVRVSWFVCLLDAKGSKMMPVLLTVEAQLSLHKCNIVKTAPEALEWQETGKPDNVRICTGITVLCVP